MDGTRRQCSVCSLGILLLAAWLNNSEGRANSSSTALARSIDGSECPRLSMLGLRADFLLFGSSGGSYATEPHDV
ncbi:hypothetical protein A3748_05105 [Erythrobacter sp. HI0077]|nr:hypothetical protein A3745_09605 [Erythrobacter sp. HI0074]KZZ05478.1 hypothetical protein A3748_05105 [Erythrobacter sp. HI0077]